MRNVAHDWSSCKSQTIDVKYDSDEKHFMFSLSNYTQAHFHVLVILLGHFRG